MRWISKARLLAALAIGAGSYGLMAMNAAEPDKGKAALKESAPADETAVRALLRVTPKFDADQVTVKELFKILSKEHGLTVRLDLAAFKRFPHFCGDAAGAAMLSTDSETVLIAHRAEAAIEESIKMYDVKIRLSIVAGMTLSDVLTDLCAQLPGKCTYRIRHNQVLIGPAFLPPVVPGANNNNSGEVYAPLLPASVILEQLFGEAVSVAIDDKPLTEAIRELRKLTGANIVLDIRMKEQAKAHVSGTFDSVRLLTVLELLTDMGDLKVVSNNNVFYITDAANAETMQRRVHRDLFGTPPMPTVPFAPMPEVKK